MKPSGTMQIRITNRLPAQGGAAMLLAGLLWCLGAPEQTLAQATCSVEEGQRTCVVDPGFGTLNQAVAADTTSTGERVDPNTVYVLQREGLYLLNGALENTGYHLQIVGEEGAGHPAIVQPGVDITGASSRAFVPRGDLTVKGFYVTHQDDAGSVQINMFRIRSDNVRVVVEDMFLEYDQQSFFRFDANGIRLFLIDSNFRNSSFLPVPTNGRIIDTRGNTPDSIWVENNTFYHYSHDFLRDGGGVIPFFHFNHNTIYNGGYAIDLNRAVKARVTNNLLVNPGTYPEITTETIEASVIELDSLRVPEMTEADRDIVIRNNNVVYTQPWLDWYNSVDSLSVRELLGPRGTALADANANIVVENTISEVVDFADAPAEGPYVAFWMDRFANPANEDPPEFRADGNGVFDVDDFPTIGIGELPLDFDFSYSTTATSFTAADGGFPLGDLNWFPEQKAQWVQTAAEDADELPDNFKLHGNYPNPFNPVTTIRFDLPVAGQVSVEIYDLVGRRVMALPAQQMQAGRNQMVRVDASSLASGVYLYRVTAGNRTDASVRTGRMVLLK